MTRKDFELIAECVAASRFDGEDGAAARRADTIANLLSDRLRAMNERFDRARFLKACGVKDD